MTGELLLSRALLREWQETAVKIEQDIARKSSDLAALKNRIQAGVLLLGDENQPPPSFEIQSKSNGAGQGGANTRSDDASDKMIEAMAAIANGVSEPITKTSMKSRLRGLGFDEGRMQNYFYTCIARLKAKRRITVLEDGRIWKAAPQ